MTTMTIRGLLEDSHVFHGLPEQVLDAVEGCGRLDHYDAGSAFFRAGEPAGTFHVILQGRVYSPPYVIKAIGDTGRLQRSLAADPTIQIYQQYVAAVGLGWDVSVEPKAPFPAYSGSVEQSHAQVIR